MAHRPDDPLTIGSLTLVVADLDRCAAFYRDAIGLRTIEAEGASMRLGVGGTVLLVLEQDRSARLRSPREAGLFHTAFLLPSRADLGRWVAHAARTRLPLQGMADHLVSEAFYLADPEGNGIEVYADRPREDWQWRDGTVAMANEPVDMAALASAAGPSAWVAAPQDTVIGHVHLQVGAIAPAEAFYAGVLGFDLTCRYPGGSFFGSGGYHHHLATNIWNSRGALVRTDRTTGLDRIVIEARDPSQVEAIETRAVQAGAAVEREPNRDLVLRDPWGTRLSVRSALSLDGARDV